MAIGQPTQPTEEESSEQETDVIFEVRDARVQFDMARGQAWVLNGVDLDIYRNEILGVVGESGSGKSMFASALLDAVEDPGVLTGEIRYYPDEVEEDSQFFDAEDATGDDILEYTRGELQEFRWEEVAMVFQGALDSFNPTMKVLHHFQETIRAHNADMSERMDFVRTLFEALHLDYDRVMRAYPHELSGGMKQRALIALALVLDPDVLVMDEPTAALDLLMQRSIIMLLRQLRDEFDLTIVFITHDLSLLAGLTDRLAVMYAFEFVEVGDSTDLLMDAAHPYTRALLRSLPSLMTDIDEMVSVPGARPDPVNIPNGCSYHPRCPVADDRCTEEDPGLVSLDEEAEHAAACFYTDRARLELDYTLHDERGHE